MKSILLAAFFFLSLAQPALAQSINIISPSAGSAYNTTTSIAVIWSNDSAGGLDHFQVWYTTNPSASCSVSSSSIPCPASVGDWFCIQSMPFYGQQADWTAPDINSSAVRVMIEAHDAGHATIKNVCSGSFTIAKPPSEAKNLLAQAVNTTYINIVWNAGSGLIELYEIFRNGTNFANTSELKYLDSGLSPDTGYEYYLVSYNSIGVSSPTAVNYAETIPVPPKIISSSPTSPFTGTPVTPAVFSIATDQQCTIQWHLNKTIVQTNNGVASASYINSSFVVGNWNVTALASNENGTASYEWIFNVVNALIMGYVQPTEPDSATVASDYAYINVSVVNTSAVISCHLDWAGTNYSMSIMTHGSGITCGSNRTDLTEGTYLYKAYAGNQSGQLNLTPARSITIDFQPLFKPSINYTLPDEVVNNTDVSFSVNVTDNSAVAGIWASVTRPGGSSQTFNISNNAQNLFYVGMTGQHGITIYAVDDDGNLASVSDSFNSVICINNQTRACGNIVSDAGACEFGTQLCVNNSWGPCTGIIGPSNETCNGIDDDCDGAIDDNSDCCEDLQTRQCGTEIGICEFGSSVCTNRVWGPCIGSIGPEQADICNDGLDNNCNGEADEACESIDVTCSNGVLDANEKNIDCGGACPRGCFSALSILGFIMIVAGVVILVAIIFLMARFRAKGKDLTWDELKKKWTPAGKI